MWSGTALYPVYAAGEAYWEISPLTDQGIAGMIMMIEGALVTLGVLAWTLLRWAARDTEKQRLLDLAAERGVPLAPERAERAVAAGHGARLEERLKRVVSRNRFLYVLVFTVGISTLGAEIAAARLLGPVLRRLHDRLGEHDRRRPRRALGRLLVRRPARRPLPRAAPALPGRPRRRRRWSR